MSAPASVKVKAIDVKPYRYAAWCTVALGKGGRTEPFANVIEHRSWSKDGESIWFMLGSHNFVRAQPDEEMELIEHNDGMPPELLARLDAEDAAEMANLPVPKVPCATCGQPTEKR